MNKNFSSKLGWLVAGGLAVVLFLSGFNQDTAKFGVVDMNKAMNDAKAGIAANESLKTELAKRQGLLEFIATQRVLTVAQATQLKELTLKPNPTAADTAALEKLKNTIIADAKNYDALQRKSQPTEADRALLAEYGTRMRDIEGLLAQWDQAFTMELSQLRDTSRDNVLAKARAAVQSVAQKQGYSIVFESNVAIYGANDLTAEAIKTMDAS